MKLNIGIIDYKLGNLFSVNQACIHSGLNPLLISDPDQLKNVDGIILPGVGAFGEAELNLKNLNLGEAIVQEVVKGKPLLGVCLGMQLLFEGSEEFGNYKGLGLIKGKIKKFTNPKKEMKVPHTGWNEIDFVKNDKILKNISPGELMYFVHSFYAEPQNENDICTTTKYFDSKFTSSILKENIFATQFHPEKSGQKGIQLYMNWRDLFFK